MKKLYKDPIGTAEKAAKAIAKITGIAKHDVALVMGSINMKVMRKMD